MPARGPCGGYSLRLRARSNVHGRLVRSDRVLEEPRQHLLQLLGLSRFGRPEPAAELSLPEPDEELARSRFVDALDLSARVQLGEELERRLVRARALDDVGEQSTVLRPVEVLRPHLRE